MVLPIYLAMNGRDLQNAQNVLGNVCWMSCAFSSWDDGLSNMPVALPPESMIILDDSFPPADHSAQKITQQFCSIINQWNVTGIILDFQRPYQEKNWEIATALRDVVSCPVAVTPTYAQKWNGPVFLPPIPLNCVGGDYIEKWQGREIWMELDDRCFVMQLTQEGCSAEYMVEDLQEPLFYDRALHCHYQISFSSDRVDFKLKRTWEDWESMFEEVKRKGVTRCIGLYQEFNQFYLPA